MCVQLVAQAEGDKARGMKQPVALMPPEDFLPFMIPFKGGPGPLCGGASTETFQWSPGSYFKCAASCLSTHARPHSELVKREREVSAVCGHAAADARMSTAPVVHRLLVCTIGGPAHEHARSFTI